MNKINKLQCQECGKEYKMMAGLCRHLKFTHKLNLQKYYDKYFKKSNEGFCIHCNKSTNFEGFTNGYYRYCNMQCYWKTDKAKQKAGDRGKNHWKDSKYRNNIISKLKENAKDPNFIKKQKSNALNIAKNPEWIKRVSEGTKKGQAKNLHFKEIRRQYMLDGGAAHCNKFVQNPSKPQVELFKLVQQVTPYPIINYPCLNKSIDIVIPSLSLAIEYDGSYWHQDKKADEKRQQLLEGEGWQFIRYVDRVPSIKELKNDILKILCVAE